MLRERLGSSSEPQNEGSNCLVCEGTCRRNLANLFQGGIELRIAVIGAGKMGLWFSRFFAEQGMSVVVYDRDNEKLGRAKDELQITVALNIADAVRNVERVLLCVPLEDLEQVLNELSLHIGRKQVVMDICSVKEVPVKLMHKYLRKTLVLGTHPIFGPGANSIRNQNYVLTPTTKRERQLAKEFGQWLRDRQVNVSVMSPGKHDELMSVVLGLPQVFGLIACDTLLTVGKLVQAQKVSGPTFRMLLTFAEAIAHVDTALSASIEMTLPGADKMTNLLVKKTREWQKMIKDRDSVAFVRKAELVKRKLKTLDPTYAKSYDKMYRLLEKTKS